MPKKTTTKPVIEPVTTKPKKSSKFDPAKIVFLVGVALIVVGGGYFAINKLFFPPPVPSKTVTGQQVLIPAAWSMYTNKLLGFSIAHPSYYKVKESTTDLFSAANAGSGGVFSVGFVTGDDKAPLGVNVTHQTLDQAIAYAKYNISRSDTKTKKLTITRDTPLTVNGHQAIRLDVHTVDTSSGGANTDFTDIYVSANGIVYNIATELSGLKPFDDSNAQTMYKSFAISNL